ncbi:MAG: rhomboid family intramembrane serine protease [Halieaceae bacterium]|nr:rhomboid family intramembrane serine protease [Halieaceae bacterium]MCP5163904.1 rhomboid family intramembrane serine protease [Pseudomonadales bacterium]MCP5202954.1 rhomboid family intramembrane serine protease [Pseudomonadales bacterium]
MTALHHALSVDVEEDLLPLSALLRQRGIVHRVFEEGGRQVLAVELATQVEPVRHLYQVWRAGGVRIELGDKGRSVSNPLPVNWRDAPVTLALIGLSVLGFGLFYLPLLNSFLPLFTFSPFTIVQGRPLFGTLDGEYWRLLTPAFLHFGWLHIVFNSLWLWELGGKLERVTGHLNMFGLFLVIAVVSNTSQYMVSGPSLFGGMSGVVYGLLGFSWVAPLLQPAWRIQPSPAIMLFMVGWLLACMLGVVEGLGFGAIANAAHLGGLLCGAVLGALFGLISREWAQ